MNVKHMRAIALKELFHVLRDPGTLLLVTVGPVFLMVVFTYTMTSDVKNAPVAVIDHSGNTASRELIERIDASGTVKVEKHLDDVSETNDLFERSKIVAAIVIPQGYGEITSPAHLEAILAGTESLPQAEAIIDGTEPVSAEKVLDEVYRISSEHTRQITETAAAEYLFAQVYDTGALAAALDKNGQNLSDLETQFIQSGFAFAILEDAFAGTGYDVAPLKQAFVDFGFDAHTFDPPIMVEEETRFNPDLRSVVDIYPGLVGMMLTLPAIALAMSLARENELGTLEQLVATPIDKRAMLVGKMMPYLVFSMVDVYILLVLGQVVYDVPFRGSLVWYSLVAFLYVVGNLGMGLLIAVLIRSQQVAVIVAMLVFFVPPFFLSGLFFPAEAMPWIVQLEMIEFPSTHFVTASRAIQLQGTSITKLWFPVIVLAILAVEILEIATFIFRKKVIITFSFRKLIPFGWGNTAPSTHAPGEEVAP